VFNYVNIITEKQINTEENDTYRELVITDNHSNNGLSVTISSRDEKKEHPEFEKLKNRKLRILIEIV